MSACFDRGKIVGFALFGAILVTYPLSSQAQEGDAFGHYCSEGYQLYAAYETQCDPGMFSAVYREGISEFDIHEAWACRPVAPVSRQHSACPGWSQKAAGAVQIKSQKARYVDSDGTIRPLGAIEGEVEVPDGLYYCCYTRSAFRAGAPRPNLPTYRSHKLPGITGWTDPGAVPPDQSLRPNPH